MTVLAPETALADRRQMQFTLAIKRVEPFNQLYEKLKGNRLPAQDVLIDLLTNLPTDDRGKCAKLFIQNARDLNMVRELAGAERIISIEQVLEELPRTPDGGSIPVVRAEDRQAPSEERSDPPKQTEEKAGSSGHTDYPIPSVHIDVNIHIDASATAEQIEKIFSSMAIYLYGRKE
jgi:hypothetical protein